MPTKKSKSKKTQNQKVKGKSNNVNQNNINIKIGGNRRKSKPSQPKPPQQSGSNIVVHVAPTPQTKIDPGFHINKEPVQQLGQPISTATAFPVPPTPAQTNPLEQRQSNPYAQVYHRNDNPHIPEPQEIKYDGYIEDDDTGSTMTGDSMQAWHSPLLQHIQPLSSHFKGSNPMIQNEDVDEIEAYDAQPNAMSAFETPHQATKNNLAPKTAKDYIVNYDAKEADPMDLFQTGNQATTGKLGGLGNKDIQIQQDMTDGMSAKDLTNKYTKQELNHYNKMIYPEELSQHAVEDNTHKASSEPLPEMDGDELSLFKQIKKGTIASSTLYKKNNLQAFKQLGERYKINTDRLSKQQIYWEIKDLI